MVDTAERHLLPILIAKYWANWLGNELNHDKRENPRAATRHLGFFIDLKHKMVAITMKHRRKVIAYFNSVMLSIQTGGCISVKSIQRMLGLQI